MDCETGAVTLPETVEILPIRKARWIDMVGLGDESAPTAEGLPPRELYRAVDKRKSHQLAAAGNLQRIRPGSAGSNPACPTKDKHGNYRSY